MLFIIESNSPAVNDKYSKIINIKSSQNVGFSRDHSH